MKTRGKGKNDVGITNYAKDTLDPRDFGDDGEDTNGYSEDRGDDAAQARSDTRGARTAGNRRGGRRPITGNARAKTDKSIMETAEFQDVVRGFFDFIEEIKRKKKKDPKNRDKPLKPSEELEKKVKPNPQIAQSQPAGKSDMQLEDIGPDKDKNLYSFKQDVNARKDLLVDMKNKEPANIFPPPLQPQDPIDLRAKDSAKQKEPANKLGFPGPGYLPSANLPSLNNPPKPQLGKPLQNLYFDNPALFPDRLPLQNFADQNLLRNYYMSPYDAYPYGLNSNQLLNYQLLEALLQKSQPELLTSLLEAQAGGGGGGSFYDLQRELQQYRNAQLGLGNPRFGNPSLGARLIENEPEVLNPKGFEGKLGRAATHVAIAYFIYFKSLDPDTIAKADKSKMDPTYNARMLKEKRTDPYPNEIPAMSGKLGQYYSGLQPDNNFNLPIEYLERRLIGDQRFIRDQVPAGYQGKNEPKVEEELPKKRTSEAREAARQTAKQKPPREEDIIQIEENSDVEPEKPQQSNQKPETKANPVEVKAQPSKSEQAVRAELPKKPDEKVGNESAEDIVQEISELIGHSRSGEGDKRKNARRPPSKSASEENTKPPNQGLVSQKVYEVDESELPVIHTDTKNEPKGNQSKDADKGIQVISSDESPSRKDSEQKEKKENEQTTENKDEKQETKPENADATASVNEENEKAVQNP